MTDAIDELPDPDGSNTLPVPPGPWFGHDNLHTQERWIREGDTIYALRENAEGRRVNVFSVHIQNDNRLATAEELEANVLLLHAAPALLAALETAYAWSRASFGPRDPRPQCSYCHAAGHWQPDAWIYTEHAEGCVYGPAALAIREATGR